MVLLTNFECGYELWEADYQEEHVEEELKLVKKYNRDESEDVVLGVVNFVVHVPSWIVLSPIQMYSTLLKHYRGGLDLQVKWGSFLPHLKGSLQIVSLLSSMLVVSLTKIREVSQLNYHSYSLRRQRSSSWGYNLIVVMRLSIQTQSWIWIRLLVFELFLELIVLLPDHINLSIVRVDILLSASILSLL